MSQPAVLPSYSLPPGEAWPRRLTRWQRWRRGVGGVAAGVLLTLGILWALGLLAATDRAGGQVTSPSSSPTSTSPTGAP